MEINLSIRRDKKRATVTPAKEPWVRVELQEPNQNWQTYSFLPASAFFMNAGVYEMPPNGDTTRPTKVRVKVEYPDA